jgi:hypothetical protein
MLYRNDLPSGSVVIEARIRYENWSAGYGTDALAIFESDYRGERRCCKPGNCAYTGDGECPLVSLNYSSGGSILLSSTLEYGSSIRRSCGGNKDAYTDTDAYARPSPHYDH